ncbi:MAG: hypothetical protein ABFE07_08840 [Armatimonadia bacterium]
MSALDADTRTGLSGPGVACCLSTLLRASRVLDGNGIAGLGTIESGGLPPLLQISSLLQQQAERTIATSGLVSRFAEVGVRALGTTVFDAGASADADTFHITADSVAANLARYSREQQLNRLAVCFLAHDFNHLFSHFVTRDVSDFTGTEALPTELQRSQLRDAVARYCHEAALAAEAAVHEGMLAEALRADEEEGRLRFGEVLADLTRQGLDRIAAGGAA